MNLPQTGGCVCGAVRYEIGAEPIVMFHCHCRDCQRVSGGAGTPVFYVPKDAFKVTKGEIRHFATQAERGGENKRGFCATCGSRLTGGESQRGVGVTAGSLDDPSVFQPKFHIFVKDTQEWDQLDHALHKFETYPE